MSDTLKPLFSWRGAIADSGLSPVTRHVAVALSLYMSERGDSAFPGASRLAHDTGLHVSTVRERLGELERAGWLRCLERGGAKGEQKHANVYQAAIPDPALPLAVGDPSPPTTRRQERVDPSPVAHLPLAVGDPISYGTPKNSKRGARPTQGRRIPLPFIVSEGNRAWAAREFPDFDWDKEGPNFVDYWKAQPGAKGVKLDWDATWRTWMRRAAAGVFR